MNETTVPSTDGKATRVLRITGPRAAPARNAKVSY